jgi:hypothetical protein
MEMERNAYFSFASAPYHVMQRRLIFVSHKEQPLSKAAEISFKNFGRIS